MKVKIGNTTYDSSDEPIMLIMNEQDKFNISHMHPDATKYCSYPEEINKETIYEFMGITEELEDTRIIEE
jgi:hypothetical protein